MSRKAFNACTGILGIASIYVNLISPRFYIITVPIYIVLILYGVKAKIFEAVALTALVILISLLLTFMGIPYWI